MLQGAIVGIIVAIVLTIIRKNKEKKALAKVMNDDVIDQPDFAAYFHYASEETFNKKSIKFFDSNGVATLNGSQLNYQPDQKAMISLSLDLKNAELSLAPKKRKMKWLEINENSTKHYITTFTQGAFGVDKSKMEEFITRLQDQSLL